MVSYIHVRVNGTNLDQFVITDYRRKIREAATFLLAQALEKDRTFQNPLHVNKVDGKYRVIDGNHRLEAVKIYLRRWPDGEVDIPLAVHEGMDGVGEKKLFDELAKTVGQTTSDYVRIHFEEVPLFKKIDHNFPVPVSIYSTKAGLTFASLVRFWYSKESATPRKLTKEDTILYAQTIEKDYTEMKDFFNWYKNFFGTPANTNPYWRYYVTWIMGSIYFRNRVLISEGEIWERLHKKLFGNVIILDTAKSNSHDYATDARRLVLDILNQGWRGNQFI